MPEALVAVPPLSIPLENASEIENTSAASEIIERSGTENSNTNRYWDSSRKRSNGDQQCKRKMRKSVGKRYQKKTPLRPVT